MSVPYLAVTLCATIYSPLLVVPVLDSIVEAEGRPPQLASQLSVLFRLKGKTLMSVQTLMGPPVVTFKSRQMGAEATDHFADAVL